MSNDVFWAFLVHFWLALSPHSCCHRRCSNANQYLKIVVSYKIIKQEEKNLKVAQDTSFDMSWAFFGAFLVASSPHSCCRSNTNQYLKKWLLVNEIMKCEEKNLQVAQDMLNDVSWTFFGAFLVALSPRSHHSNTNQYLKKQLLVNKIMK